MLSNKLVVIIAAEAPVGVALNTAALLGVALGHHHDDTVGPDAVDASGTPHTGMCVHPIPVLRAPADHLTEIRAQAATKPDITIHDMNQVAQQSRTYNQFLTTMTGTKPEDLDYLGLALYGPAPPSTPSPEPCPSTADTRPRYGSRSTPAWYPLAPRATQFR